MQCNTVKVHFDNNTIYRHYTRTLAAQSSMYEKKRNKLIQLFSNIINQFEILHAKEEIATIPSK